MQIPGGEKYLAPDTEDEAPDCDHDGATLLSMAEGGFPGQYACSRCGAPFRPTADLAGEEEDVEIDEELEIAGQYDDLRILEIPLAAHYRASGPLKLFVEPEPRYAILGVPKIGFSEDDRKAIQRILYAVRISAVPTAGATTEEPTDG